MEIIINCDPVVTPYALTTGTFCHAFGVMKKKLEKSRQALTSVLSQRERK